MEINGFLIVQEVPPSTSTEIVVQNTSTNQLEKRSTLPQTSIDNLVTDLTNKQDITTRLTNWLAYNTNGIVVQTSSTSWVNRVITGTTNEIIVTNGDGISANPIISLDSTFLANNSLWQTATASSNNIRTKSGFNDIVGTSTHCLITGGTSGNTSQIANSVSSVILGGNSHQITSCTNAGIFVGIDNEINSSSTNSVIIGGSTNIITSSIHASIIGGTLSSINTTSNYSSITGGSTNDITSSTHSFIGGGVNNTIDSSLYSAILAGHTNTLNGTSYSAILAGQNITASQSNTAYTEKFNIKTMNGTTAATPLAVDSNGFVVDGSLINPRKQQDFLTGDASRTTTTTLSNLGLSASLISGRNYIIEGLITTTCNAGAGIKIDLTYGGTVSNINIDLMAFNGTTLSAHTLYNGTTMSSTVIGSTTANPVVHIKGIIRVSTSSTLNVRAAQNVSGPTSFIYQGSYLTVTEIV